jgi:hypothetical protein
MEMLPQTAILGIYQSHFSPACMCGQCPNQTPDAGCRQMCIFFTQPLVVDWDHGPCSLMLKSRGENAIGKRTSRVLCGKDCPGLDFTQPVTRSGRRLLGINQRGLPIACLCTWAEGSCLPTWKRDGIEPHFFFRIHWFICSKEPHVDPWFPCPIGSHNLDGH